MRKWVADHIWVLALIATVGCKTIVEPGVEPPQPRFVPQSLPPDTVDRGFNAEVSVDTAIRFQWFGDRERKTDGYLIYRSEDDTMDGDFLKNKRLIAEITSSNQLFDPLDTLFVDTVGVQSHKRYYYQLQSYNLSLPKTYSKPTPVQFEHSFYLTAKPSQAYPTANGVLEPNLPFTWVDEDQAGVYQVMVRRVDNNQYVWSSREIMVFSGFAQSAMYGTEDSTAVPLISGVEYEWRVKSLVRNAGNTSKWQRFRVK
jgi:hypothetical protein